MPPKKMNKDDEIIRLLREISENVLFLGQQINNANIRLIEIESILEQEVPATGLTITQKGGNKMQVQAGQTGVFQETPVPTGGALQAGAIPLWTVDDTAEVTLTPSADGTTVSVAVSPAAVASSFNLTVTGVSSSGATISDTVNVLITPVAPPPPTPATGFVITQLS